MRQRLSQARQETSTNGGVGQQVHMFLKREQQFLVCSISSRESEWSLFENKNDGRDWTLSDEQLGEYLLDSVGQQKRPLTEKREHGATAVFLFFSSEEVSLRF